MNARARIIDRPRPRTKLTPINVPRDDISPDEGEYNRLSVIPWALNKMAQTRKNRIGPLRQHDLSKYGYSHVKRLTVEARHAALTKAVKAYTALSVFRKLNAVYVLTRGKTRKSNISSRIFLKDRDWVKATFF